MSATTSWFFCGKCGFKNHPRPAAAPSYQPHPTVPGAYILIVGDSLCEQCGTPHDDPRAVDYTPGG